MTRPISSLAATTRLNVLVLEDQMFQRNLLVGVLKHLGIESVVSASSGQEALDIIMSAKVEFDVAICDLQMDGMDGIEFVRRAASLKVRSFIVTSAMDANLLASAEAVVRSYDTRILGVLPKPINVTRLTQMLHQCHNRIPLEELRPQEYRAALPTAEELSTAFATGDIEPVFAPKSSIDTGATTGAEMLIRWANSGFDGISFNAFIRAVESSGLEDAYIHKLYPAAMESAGVWTAAGHDIGLALNLPATALVKPDFPMEMVGMARRHDIAPGRITFEVAQTVGFESLPHYMAGLTRLRMYGFHTCLDDFGAGHLSLFAVGDMPFSEIKFGRKFIAFATAGRRGRLIAESLISLVKKLELHTASSAIDTPAELDVVKTLGIETVQGCLLAAPMSSQELLNFLNSTPSVKQVNG